MILLEQIVPESVPSGGLSVQAMTAAPRPLTDVVRDLYDVECAYGRGWRAGFYHQEYECPYADEEEKLAHRWMDGYDEGKKAFKVLGQKKVKPAAQQVEAVA